MNRALWLLLALQLRGWLRYLGRSMRTLRGAVLVLVGLGVFLPWMLAVLLHPVAGGADAAAVARLGPAILLLYCVANVVFSSNERAVYFTPAEVQMLFAGPFGRREVLLYKILLALLVSLPATLFMGAVVRVRQGWPPAVLTGLLLIAIFMQLFSMALGLVANSLGAHLFGRGRKIAAIAVVTIVLIVLAQAVQAAGAWQPRALLERALDSEVWRVVSWPLQAYFDAMVAEHLWPDLVRPALIALAVNVCLVAVVLALDRHYQEASSAASARVYARLLRMRGRSAGAEGGAAQPRPARLEVPELPFWGGVGPILWRQLTTGLRGIGRILLVLFVLGTILMVPMLGSALEETEAVVPTVVGLAIWLSVFLTALVPFDFRGDIDRIATLKTLPIVPWRLVIGQLLTPVLLLSLMQALGLIAAHALAPDNPALLLALAAYVLPFNFALVALENLLFLLFPMRLMATTPGDFQALGRNVLLSIGKVIGIGMIALAAGIVGAVGGLLSGNVWLGVAAAWPVVVLCGAALVPLVALAFGHFDVGRDTPA